MLFEMNILPARPIYTLFCSSRSHSRKLSYCGRKEATFTETTVVVGAAAGSGDFEAERLLRCSDEEGGEGGMMVVGSRVLGGRNLRTKIVYVHAMCDVLLLLHVGCPLQMIRRWTFCPDVILHSTEVPRSLR